MFIKYKFLATIKVSIPLSISNSFLFKFECATGTVVNFSAKNSHSSGRLDKIIFDSTKFFRLLIAYILVPISSELINHEYLI